MNDCSSSIRHMFVRRHLLDRSFLVSPYKSVLNRNKELMTALLCDYDNETFATHTTRATSNSRVWSLGDDEIWTLAHSIATGVASDEQTCLFVHVLLARAIPAESLKRALLSKVQRCTIEVPRLYEHPDSQISFDVLLRDDEDHTEEGSVSYTITPNSWSCECQGWGGDRIVQKFSLWRTPPSQLQGAHRRNVRRTQRRRLRKQQDYIAAVHDANQRREQLYQYEAALSTMYFLPPSEWSEA